jgi:hypothetical protein
VPHAPPDGQLSEFHFAQPETYDQYKDSAPGNSGWEIKRQRLEWVVPWHDGALAKAWMKARADGLNRAGMEVLMTEW